ncbi:radical SAM protein [Bradyrhizobium septentrionale]|uniref:radical SAM protein n=1 Tax=Bradyrhizobium septentrionale TaxID=1404411 RepID=UPI0030D08A1F
MKALDLVSLGTKHVRNALSEELYLRTGRDVTRPAAIFAEVVERCNYKCRYCDYWRRPNYRDEMSIDEWQRALASLKEFIGAYHVEFAGGEPYIKKGFLDLLRFCRDNDIHWGVTTNGGAYLNKKIVAQTVEARPFNINISIDSTDPTIHNYSRGVENSLSDIVQGIRNVAEQRRAEGLDFPIIIKPVVHKLNFRRLPEMVDWIQQIGATALSFQPVEQGTQEVEDELWIGESELDDLIKVRDELLRLKRAGAPILNGEAVLRAWPNHFRREKAPKEVMPCRVGMRNYFIPSDGRLEVCWFFKPIGNVRTQTAREIWYSEEAQARRKETIACDKLCLFTCLAQRTLQDKLKMGLTLLTNTKAA